MFLIEGKIKIRSRALFASVLHGGSEMRIYGFVEGAAAFSSWFFEDTRSLTGRPSPSHLTGPFPSSAWPPRVPAQPEDLPGPAHLLSGRLLPSPSYFYSFCNGQLKPKDPPGNPTSLSLFWKFPEQAESMSHCQHPSVIHSGSNQVISSAKISFADIFSVHPPQS